MANEKEVVVKDKNGIPERIDIPETVPEVAGKPSEATPENLPTGPAEPEKKKESVKQPEEKPEKDEVVPKKVFLSRIKEESDKRKVYQSRVAELETQLQKSQTIDKITAGIKKISEEEGWDEGTVGKVKNILLEGQKDISEAEKEKKLQALKPQKVEEALKKVLDRDPRLKDFESEIKEELEKTKDMALLDDDSALEWLGHSTAGMHQEEIIKKEREIAVEEAKKNKQIVQSVQPATPSVSNLPPQKETVLTEAEKNWGKNRGFSEEETLEMKKKKGYIPLQGDGR